MKKTLINYLVPWVVLIATGCGLKSSPFDYLSNVSSKEIAATMMRVGAGANPNLSDNQRMSIYGGAYLLEKSGERDYSENLRAEETESTGGLPPVERFDCKYAPRGVREIRRYRDFTVFEFCNDTKTIIDKK